MKSSSNNRAAGDGYYRSLTRKMIAVMILVSVAPLLIISGTILYYFDVSYREKALDHLQVLVRKHRRTIDTYLEEKLANIRTLARSCSFDQLTNEGFLEEKLRILREDYGPAFVDLGVVNDQGIQISYAGPYRLRDADYSRAEWFKEAVNRDQYISDVFKGLRGHPHFIVAVRRNHNGAKWILRATVDFEAFNSMVERIRVGTTGFAFILNRKGEFQTMPRRDEPPRRGSVPRLPEIA